MPDRGTKHLGPNFLVQLVKNQKPLHLRHNVNTKSYFLDSL